MPDLTDIIEESASGPKKAKGDQGEMEQHPLPDVIDAKKFVAADEAAKTRPARGLRFNTWRNPGAE